MNVFVYLSVLMLLLVSEISALSFMLPQNTRKCLMEEIHKNVLVTGEYKLSQAPGHTTSLKVGDSKGHTLYSKEDAVEGKFAFTTDDKEVFDKQGQLLYNKDDAEKGKFALTGDETDNFYSICLETKVPYGMRAAPAREVFLDVKHGVEAKSYEDIAKSEKLKPMEIELRRLEDLSEAIVNDFAYMKKREEEMRDTNESTNSRVLYFSIFSMCCLLCLATWQVFYLRRYFKSKKLIE